MLGNELTSSRVRWSGVSSRITSKSRLVAHEINSICAVSRVVSKEAFGRRLLVGRQEQRVRLQG